MKTFNFDYTDRKFTLKLLAWSFLTLVLLLVAMVVTVDLIGVVGSLVLAFGAPLLIFFLNKKKIKKQGTATIQDSYSEFKLAESTDKVFYSDIRTYQVERYNGTHLKIKFRDGQHFKLQANSNFCNPDQFDTFCQEFDNTLLQYMTINNVEMTRKKSMFERAWMLPFLISLTLVLIGGILFVIYEGEHIPPTFYTSAAVMIPMWIGYLNSRKRKKDRETKLATIKTE